MDRMWRSVLGSVGIAAIAAMAVLLLGASSSLASSSNPACPGADSSTATSCTYTTAGSSTFTVPGGISTVDVTAVGAAGGAAAGSPGSGASVEDAAVAVTAGDTLSVVVGGVGGSGASGGAGGTPGGGGQGAGGVDTGAGGGGYSGVFGPSGDSDPLVIAGGGGGSGQGSGGDGDTGSGGGSGYGGVEGGGGGGGGTTTNGGGAEGAGSDGGGNGGKGSYLTGGNGGSGGAPGGGGGGGGYYGGGGGGGSSYGGGGGGGGGASYGVSPGLTNEKTATGVAEVKISFSMPTPTISTSQQPSSATVGSQIADKATVSGGNSPTGKVTFDLYDNASASGSPLFTDTESLSSGTATSEEYTTTGTGTDYWVATYNGDTYNNSVSSTDSAEPVTVGAASPSISTSAKPTAATVGSQIADEVTVSGGYDPTGTVTFDLYDNSTASGSPLFHDTQSLSGGTATSKEYKTTKAGTDYWVATYNGDDNNNPVSSGDASEPVVVKARVLDSTRTGVSCSPNPATAGKSTTCTATVTDTASPPSAPTGAVSFTASGQGAFSPALSPAGPHSSSTATCTLSPAGTGRASCSVSYTPPASGSQKLTASYGGDGTHAASKGSTTLTARSAPATTKPALLLGISPHKVTAGLRVCFRVTARSNGHGVAEVSVRLAGHRTRTSSLGWTRICVRLGKGVHTVIASKSGYKTARANVRAVPAKRKPPRFTG